MSNMSFHDVMSSRHGVMTCRYAILIHVFTNLGQKVKLHECFLSCRSCAEHPSVDHHWPAALWTGGPSRLTSIPAPWVYRLQSPTVPAEGTTNNAAPAHDDCPTSNLLQPTTCSGRTCPMVPPEMMQVPCDSMTRPPPIRGGARGHGKKSRPPTMGASNSSDHARMAPEPTPSEVQAS